MKIRPGVHADLAAIVALDRATETAPHWSEAAYQLASSSADRCLLVAEEGRLVGFAAAAIVAGEVELESIAVEPDSQRRGIARALCESIICWARTAGAQVLTLEVRSSSIGAGALYRSLGFIQIGSRPGYYAKPSDDALILQLDLTRSE